MPLSTAAARTAAGNGAPRLRLRSAAPAALRGSGCAGTCRAQGSTQHPAHTARAPGHGITAPQHRSTTMGTHCRAQPSGNRGGHLRPHNTGARAPEPRATHPAHSTCSYRTLTAREETKTTSLSSWLANTPLPRTSLTSHRACCAASDTATHPGRARRDSSGSPA